MPTGYTSSIKDGITFERFILNCARAFGATITMRDKPANAEIPDEFKPTDYHTKELAELQVELENVKAMTVEAAIIRVKAEYAEKIAYYEQQIKECNDLKQKYSDMLIEAKKWEPPSADHQGLKDFMIQQISSSIDFDCSTEYYEKPIDPQTGEQWLLKKTQQLLKDIAYHKKEHQAEVERVNWRNKWVKELRGSL